MVCTDVVVLEVVHGLFKEPITVPLESKMAEIRHLGSYIHTYIHKGNLYTANNTEIRVTMRLQSVETSESSNVFEM